MTHKESHRNHEKGGQADDSYEEPIKYRAGPAAPGKEALPRLSGYFLHQLFSVAHIRPQRQGGQGIRDQVDPQDMARF